MVQVKTSDKYRFSLQWSVETVEKVRVGELLESLGNKKSEFVVLAVSEYIQAHPETLLPGQTLRIVVQPNFTREQVEAMLRIIVEEKLANTPSLSREAAAIGGDSAEGGLGVEEMLKNLDLFS